MKELDLSQIAKIVLRTEEFTLQELMVTLRNMGRINKYEVLDYLQTLVEFGTLSKYEDTYYLNLDNTYN